MNVAIVSISLPDELQQRVDEVVAGREWGGRSEFVRAALTDFIEREGQQPTSGRRTATVTLIYAEEAERRVGELRHSFTDTVVAMMHGHAPGSCVEVYMLDGDTARIRRFVDQLRGLRQTRLVTVTYTDPVVADEGHVHGHA